VSPYGQLPGRLILQDKQTDTSTELPIGHKRLRSKSSDAFTILKTRINLKRSPRQESPYGILPGLEKTNEKDSSDKTNENDNSESSPRAHERKRSQSTCEYKFVRSSKNNIPERASVTNFDKEEEPEPPMTVGKIVVNIKRNRSFSLEIKPKKLVPNLELDLMPKSEPPIKRFSTSENFSTHKMESGKEDPLVRADSSTDDDETISLPRVSPEVPSNYQKRAKARSLLERGSKPGSEEEEIPVTKKRKYLQKSISLVSRFRDTSPKMEQKPLKPQAPVPPLNIKANGACVDDLNGPKSVGTPSKKEDHLSKRSKSAKTKKKPSFFKQLKRRVSKKKLTQEKRPKSPTSSDVIKSLETVIQDNKTSKQEKHPGRFAITPENLKDGYLNLQSDKATRLGRSKYQPVLIAWVNKHLKKRNMSISSLVSGLKTGVELINLLEILSHKELKAFHQKPKLVPEYLENLELGIKFAEALGVLTDATPQAIYNGDLTVIVGMLYNLIKKFKDGKKKTSLCYVFALGKKKKESGGN